MKEVRSKWIKNVYYHFVIWFVTFALLFIAGVEIGRANNESTILYLVTSRSSTSYFPEYGISMEQGTQTMIRLVPETGNAEVVDSNYSPSYSKSTIRPYTVDDRFFVFQSWYLLINPSAIFIANYFTYSKHRSLANLIFLLLLISSCYYRFMIII